MKVTREFAPASRYLYDFGLCSAKHGFSQLDTSQDAEYYGNWANPTRLIIFSYCEGDCTLTECDTDAEFVAKIRDMARWEIEDNDGKFKIDALCNQPMIARWESLGLGDLLH